jgi:hypothetical protein
MSIQNVSRYNSKPAFFADLLQPSIVKTQIFKKLKEISKPQNLNFPVYHAALTHSHIIIAVFKSCELLSDFLPFTLWKYAP